MCCTKKNISHLIKCKNFSLAKFNHNKWSKFKQDFRNCFVRLWSEALRRVGANFQPQWVSLRLKPYRLQKFQIWEPKTKLCCPQLKIFFFIESKKCFKTYLFLSWFNLVKLLRQNIFMNRVVICFLKYFRAHWSAKLLSDHSMLEVVTVFICSMHRFHHESDCKAIA